MALSLEVFYFGKWVEEVNQSSFHFDAAEALADLHFFSENPAIFHLKEAVGREDLYRHRVG